MSDDLIEKFRELTADRPLLSSLVDEAMALIESSDTLEQLEDTRVKLLGKKGTVTAVFKSLGSLSPEEKPVVGEIGNVLRALVEQELARKVEQLIALEVEQRLRREAIDVTLPGRRRPFGHKHLISQVISEVTDIFMSLGYRVVTGPEVELDYYNFEALNQPPYHPARSLQDTLYVKRKDQFSDSREDIMLRTHTSPVQIRVMETERPPLYVISPGKAYRKDEVDATHSPVFHQVEGFAVGRGITMGDLKGTLEVFVRKMFGDGRDVRFRPHFFPFTEPSAEVDVSCYACEGSGCALCKGVGWLEILGCGMIDPNVFEYVGYDPEEFTGFAFGVGIERIAMMKYNIDDMRVFYENDARFLAQF
ncbi:MAG: phenylalanine--tRNA ligase subunit alpha [Candidatus Anoxymicrobium japonicum]|uniref:Phenylalanine--tRNA ligase alpha subunit n=1 Tax=Candidatus Anoxymicrobium japonicum TaxID=2013648 RepID=A0A2N3G715_9ACTN|nr:MAG: phenylalanine--tRNA ligase subunit alpha [Candidatus Anoxymicrobium japonicum]